MRSPKAYARIGGALYLLIIIGGVFAEAFVRGGLVVSGDATATAANILQHQTLWRLGLVSDLVMLLCDVGVALILYVLLRAVHEQLALLGAFLRLVQVAISGLNGLNHLAALLLLTAPAYMAAFDLHQLRAAALFAIKLQSSGYDIALVFFGVDCFVIGGLILRSTFLPRLIGGVIVAAGICYLASSFSALLDPPLSSALFSHGILLPPFFAELSLALWLLIAGVNVPRWHAQLAATRRSHHQVGGSGHAD